MSWGMMASSSGSQLGAARSGVRRIGGDSVPEKMQAILDVFEDAQAVYEPNVSHPVLSTAEIADQVGLSTQQVRKLLSEMQGNMD